MADSPRRPLLNPVLRFTKDPRPESVTGGGKTASGIKVERLETQRTVLSEQFSELAAGSSRQPDFNGRVILYASMFDDSLAPTWTPSDLFQADRNARLVAPFRSGYLVEIATEQLKTYARLVRRTEIAKDNVDISRIEVVRFFRTTDTLNHHSIDDVWETSPEVPGGRALVVWLMPLRDREAVEQLLVKFSRLRGQTILPPAPLLEKFDTALGANVPAAMRRSFRSLATTGDRINLAMREYRQHRRSRSTFVIPSKQALVRLIASGTVFRIEPVQPITSTSPGQGREPDRPLPRNMSALPTVGVVDGGMTATSYMPAEAWRAPPLVGNHLADTAHGNRVTSLIVQGHDWNNNLTLPPLYCQIGTVQAVAKRNVRSFCDPQELNVYLDAIMTANATTRIWNFSFNQPGSCPLDSVSSLGHDIAVLARKHAILPIISIGNKPGLRLQPPADCEAAITVGGRSHGADGSPAGECSVSHCGPGPSSMLKPDISHYSNVRAIGGNIVRGSSFATALTSPLAAHTMQRLRDASPDLVKGLLLHNTDGSAFHPSLGFGTPVATSLPWECQPGMVTMQWSARLRPGVAYYWELPIPLSLRKTGKLKGAGCLTAILNPHPMVSEYAGPNYFGVRIATALQYRRGVTKAGADKFNNLLGSLDTEMITEQEARMLDHKWSPIRHHKSDFRSVAFDGNMLRVYSRVYARDLYLYGYSAASEIPEMDAIFVLTIGTGDESDDVYNELRNDLGAFVENATIDSEIDIDIENRGDEE